jgi:uncharacterized DUF497 family protein
VITWDETKRIQNIAKHGIDLALCESVFDYPMITTEDDREEYGEQRLASFGRLDGSQSRAASDLLQIWR